MSSKSGGWRECPYAGQMSNSEFPGLTKTPIFGVARKGVAQVLVRGYVSRWLLEELTRISAN